MSLRAAAVTAASCTLLAAAAAAYVIVGGLPGVLYASAVLMAGLFVAVKLGVVRSLMGPRKSAVIAELRVELEDRDRHISDLRDRLEREAEKARALHAGQEARIRELERAHDRLRTLFDEELARVEAFVGEVAGGIDQRGYELAAIEREVTALVGG